MREQIGGNHYKMAIEPIEFIERNKLTFSEGNVVKYICRHRRKNGKEDLLKARDYIDKIIRREYGEGEAENSEEDKLDAFMCE